MYACLYACVCVCFVYVNPFHIVICFITIKLQYMHSSYRSFLILYNFDWGKYQPPRDELLPDAKLRAIYSSQGTPAVLAQTFLEQYKNWKVVDAVLFSCLFALQKVSGFCCYIINCLQHCAGFIASNTQMGFQHLALFFGKLTDSSVKFGQVIFTGAFLKVWRGQQIEGLQQIRD